MGKIDYLAEVLHGTVASLTDRVDKMKVGWDQLMEANHVVSGRLDAMDRNISRIAETLARMEGNIPSYRKCSSVLENRNNMLKRIELPAFSRTDPYLWISQAERFFRLGKYNDEDRLDLLSITLQGPALHWFNREMQREPFCDWCQFKQRMIARFNQKLEENPRMRFFALKQRGSVADYVNEFEELTTIVTGVEEENLELVFYLGLKPEMDLGFRV
ncbi:unnamed protein product [Microthlaspi erraticum]|uniref:Retrotransposon gag domain-containing protein n=1 Tax=Microthlaspi erraticum TaxID=1685480 RepID=A0A6D2LNB6_9BRAS|nr:unnamed protein product [Microthlaspi erraticum]